MTTIEAEKMKIHIFDQTNRYLGSATQDENGTYLETIDGRIIKIDQSTTLAQAIRILLPDRDKTVA